MDTTKNIHYFSSFLEFYEYSISPKLRDIDIFIKTSEGFMNTSEISRLLYISDSELSTIMFSRDIRFIDSSNFFDIMECGSSYICKLFFREKNCGSPYIYTRKQIAYIYDLDINVVDIICDKLNISKITDYSLRLIFAEISLEEK